MGCREAIFVDKSTFDFPIFLLFFNAKFPIFPIFSILSFLFSYFPIFLGNHAAGHPVVGRPEGVKWDVVALGKWDLSHWQGVSITENGKKCKKWGLRVKQFQWNWYSPFRTHIIHSNSRSGCHSRMLSKLTSKSWQTLHKNYHVFCHHLLMKKALWLLKIIVQLNICIL